MDHATHNKIVSFIWSIADDFLRDASGQVFYNTSKFTLRKRLDPKLWAALRELLEMAAELFSHFVDREWNDFAA